MIFYHSYFYTLHTVKSLFNPSQEKGKIIYFTDILAECQDAWGFHIQSISVPKDADGYAVRFFKSCEVVNQLNQQDSSGIQNPSVMFFQRHSVSFTDY